MLLNSFYKILDIKQENEDWIFRIELNPEHKIFEGHFPEQPIVPGVCSLQIIKECAENILGKDIRINYISSCKYLTAINPKESRELEIRISLKDTESENISLSATGKSNEHDFIKLKATLSIA